MTTTRSALWVVEGLAVRPCAAVWLSDSERTASCRRAAAGLLHALGTRLRGDNSGQCGTAVPAPTGTGTGAGTGAGTGTGAVVPVPVPVVVTAFTVVHLGARCTL